MFKQFHSHLVTQELIQFNCCMLFEEVFIWKVLCRKGVLRKFAKFAGKHLFQSLFFIIFQLY